MVLLPSAVLAAVTLLSSATALDPPISVAIFKKASLTGSHRIRHQVAAAAFLPRHAKRTSAQLPMGDIIADVGYYAALTIGRPPVAYNFEIDTGSTALLVAGLGLSTSSHIPLYDPARSSTSRNLNITFRSDFVDGSGNYGSLYSDMASFGSGFPSIRQNISAYNVSTIGPDGVTLEEQGISGLIGFSPVNNYGENGNSFIENLYLSGALTSPEFGFAFGIQSPGKKENEYGTSGGFMVLGGVNSTFINGALEYIPLCNAAQGSGGYWSIPMTGMTIGKQSITLAQPPCMTLDTGSTSATFSSALSASLFSLIPGSKKAANGKYYTFPCVPSTNISVGLTFGKATYYIDMYDFTLTSNFQTSTCESSFTIGDENLVGDIFLKKVYSSFRLSPPAIGLAQIANPNHILESSPLPVANGTVFPTKAPTVTGLISPSNSSALRLGANGSAGHLTFCFAFLLLYIGVLS